MSKKKTILISILVFTCFCFALFGSGRGFDIYTSYYARINRTMYIADESNYIQYLGSHRYDILLNDQPLSAVLEWESTDEERPYVHIIFDNGLEFDGYYYDKTVWIKDEPAGLVPEVSDGEGNVQLIFSQTAHREDMLICYLAEALCRMERHEMKIHRKANPMTAMVGFVGFVIYILAMQTYIDPGKNIFRKQSRSIITMSETNIKRLKKGCIFLMALGIAAIWLGILWNLIDIGRR